MELNAHFLTAGHTSIPQLSFAIDHQVAQLVLSSLGHDLVMVETTPILIGVADEHGRFPPDTLLYDVQMFQSSGMAEVVDTGRIATLQYDGHVEGVTLPKGVPFRFPEVEEGYISEWVETLRQLAIDARDNHKAVYFAFPSE